MIGHFCGKTLLSLHINGFWSKYPKRLRFKSLLNLTLDNSWAKKLKFPTQLKYLGIWGHNPQGRLPLQIRRFSNLEELDLRLLDTLSYERLIQFSSLNPQVNKLTVVLQTNKAVTFRSCHHSHTWYRTILLWIW